MGYGKDELIEFGEWCEDDFSSMDEDEKEEYLEELKADTRESLRRRYKLAKSAKVGDTIMCPSCCKKFVKRTYQHTFCSSKKKNGRQVCKDFYWNRVDENRSFRASMQRR